MKLYILITILFVFSKSEEDEPDELLINYINSNLVDAVLQVARVQEFSDLFYEVYKIQGNKRTALCRYEAIRRANGVRYFYKQACEFAGRIKGPEKDGYVKKCNEDSERDTNIVGKEKGVCLPLTASWERVRKEVSEEAEKAIQFAKPKIEAFSKNIKNETLKEDAKLTVHAADTILGKLGDDLPNNSTLQAFIELKNMYEDAWKKSENL